jgi:hypothetical protein
MGRNPWYVDLALAVWCLVLPCLAIGYIIADWSRLVGTVSKAVCP